MAWPCPLGAPHGGLEERGVLFGGHPTLQSRLGPGPALLAGESEVGGFPVLGRRTPTHHAPAPGLGSWTFLSGPKSPWGPWDHLLSPQLRSGTG